MEFLNDEERDMWFRGHDDGIADRRVRMIIAGRNASRLSDAYYDGFRDGAAKRREGRPCNHAECKSHVTHPCEGCGRQWGQGESWRADK